MSQIELKPCPFCGGEGLGHGESIPAPREGMYGIVECHDCDTIVLGEDEADAIRKWNTRPLPSAGAEAVDAFNVLLLKALKAGVTADEMRPWADKVNAALASPPLPQHERTGDGSIFRTLPALDLSFDGLADDGEPVFVRCAHGINPAQHLR